MNEPLHIMTQIWTGELTGRVHIARDFNGNGSYGMAICGYGNSERTTSVSVTRPVTCKTCLRLGVRRDATKN